MSIVFLACKNCALSNVTKTENNHNSIFQEKKIIYNQAIRAVKVCSGP